MVVRDGRVGCTYGFASSEFDEGVKKRTNPSEAKGHSGILRISDENIDMEFEGLDDREYHFLKVWVQEVRLLLKTAYLYDEAGILLGLIYTDGCAGTNRRLHAIQSQRLRSGALIRRILVQVERQKVAEVLKEPFTLFEFCYRPLCDLGIVLSIHMLPDGKIDKVKLTG